MAALFCDELQHLIPGTTSSHSWFVVLCGYAIFKGLVVVLVCTLLVHVSTMWLVVLNMVYKGFWWLIMGNDQRPANGWLVVP